MPEEPGPHPTVKRSIRIVQSKLATTNDDKKKSLFRGMRDMLEDMKNIITPENANDIGDRLVIFPKYVNSDIFEKSKCRQ